MVGRRQHRGGETARSARLRCPAPMASLLATGIVAMVGAGTITGALMHPPTSTTGRRQHPPPLGPATAPAGDSEPDSSPGLPAAGLDGSQIDYTAAGPGPGRAGSSTHLFVSDRTGSYQVHLATDAGIVQLTDDEAFDHWWPHLSPDGSTVAVMRTPAQLSGFGTEGGDETLASLWTMRPDGSGMTERIAAGTFGRMGPARWSPDGEIVVFAATDPEDGRHRLWVADSREFEPQPITDGDQVVLDPTFSPDGNRLAYVAHPRGYRGDPSAIGALEVFVLDIDRRAGGFGIVPGAATRLTVDERGDRDPSWSPDGRRLAVATEVDTAGGVGVERPLPGRWGLRLVAVTEGGATTVLSDDSVNLAPAWEPSGTGLVFQRHEPAADGFTLAGLDLIGGRTVALGATVGHNDLHIEPVTGPAAWP